MVGYKRYEMLERKSGCRTRFINGVEMVMKNQNLNLLLANNVGITFTNDLGYF